MAQHKNGIPRGPLWQRLPTVCPTAWDYLRDRLYVTSGDQRTVPVEWVRYCRLARVATER